MTLGNHTEIPREVIVQAFVYKTKPRGSLREVFQQIRERMEAIAKGIVSDHWSTVIQTVTYIGFGFKNPANLGLTELEKKSISAGFEFTDYPLVQDE